MTEPTSNYPVSPPPPISPWTTQDPYAPYAGSHPRSFDEPDETGPRPEPVPPYEPYAGGPPSGRPYDPYAGEGARERYLKWEIELVHQMEREETGFRIPV